MRVIFNEFANEELQFADSQLMENSWSQKSRIVTNYWYLLLFFIFFSQSTGLVTSASSRHMEPMSNSNGISLDELAGRGNFIPRPQADVKMRWFYDLFSKKKIQKCNSQNKQQFLKNNILGYTFTIKNNKWIYIFHAYVISWNNMIEYYVNKKNFNEIFSKCILCFSYKI